MTDRMPSCQVQIRLQGGVWLPVGARLAPGAATALRREWVTSAGEDNGPDAAQYVRAHTRVLKYVVSTSTVVVED